MMPFAKNRGRQSLALILITLTSSVLITYFLNVKIIGRKTALQIAPRSRDNNVNVQITLPRRRFNSTKSFQKFFITFVNTPKWLKETTTKMDFNQCRFSNCKLSEYGNMMPKSDVLLFYGPSLSARPPKRSDGQIWIYLNLESPHNSNLEKIKSDWKYSFNWTITYRNDSNIVFPYGEIFSSKERKYVDFKTILKNKIKPISWVVSHCNAHSGRDKYVQQLRKYINVDIYGSCGNRKCETPSYLKCFQHLGLKYKFFLAFENSLCKDYYTEKIYNGYSSKVYMVPIVRGAPGYDKYFPKGTYIFTGDFSHPKDLANYLLNMSDTEYLTMLKKKLLYDSTSNLNDDIYPKVLCKLCGKLNSNDITNSINVDIMNWLWNNTCS